MTKSNEIQTTIKKGMGATICYYTDRKPATIIEVSKNKKRAKIQEDLAKRTDSNGMSSSQSYDYSRNEKGYIHNIYLSKNGKWRISYSKTLVIIGCRRKYHDYSF